MNFVFIYGNTKKEISRLTLTNFYQKIKTTATESILYFFQNVLQS